MKALEKDRTRRYESASGFAADIHRYLNNEPVVARPPSLNYRVRKFVRKNRVGVVAASLVILALVGGIVGRSFATVRAWKAEQLAEGRLKDAVKARNLEEAQRQLAVANEILANKNTLAAQQEKQVAVTVREFLQNKLLKPASVWEQANSLTPDVVGQAKYNVTVRELLDRAAAEFTPTSITSQFPDQPVVQSEILETIGQSLSSIGDHERAEEYLRASLKISEDTVGPVQSPVIKKRIALVILCLRSSKTSVALEEATSLCNLLLLEFEKLETTKSAKVVPTELERQKQELATLLHDAEIELEEQMALNGTSVAIAFDAFEGAKIIFRVAQAVPRTKTLYEQCLSEFGARDRRTLFSHFIHACALHALGQLQAATEIYENIYRIAEEDLASDDLLLAGVRKVLANIYSTTGDFARSLAFEEMVVEALVKRLGPDHPSTLINMRDLADAFIDNGQLDKALPLHERMLVSIKSKLGPDHPDTLMTMNSLALCYDASNQHDKALLLFEETLALSKVRFGLEHPETLTSLHNLAMSYEENGQIEKAIPLWEQKLELTETTLGPDHPDTSTTMTNLALGYSAANQRSKALPLLEKTLERRTAILGPVHLDTLASMNQLAVVYQDAGQPAKALPLYERTLELRKAELGADHADTLQSMSNLATCYQATNQPEKALPLLEQAFELRKAKLGAEHPDTLSSMNDLAVGFTMADHHAKALPLFEQTLELRKAKLGPNHIDTLSSMNRLAAAHKNNGHLDMALPLFEQTLELRKVNLGPDHPDTLASKNNLAMAYLDNKQLDKALPLLQESLEKLRTQLGADHRNTLHCMNNLATGYRAAGQLDKALPLYEETLEKMRTRFGVDNTDTRSVVANLLSAYAAAGEADKFETLLQDLLEDKRKSLPADSPELANILAVAGRDFLSLKRAEAAEPLLRESLDIRQTTEPEKWSTFNTQSVLGAVLLARAAASTDEAEKTKLLADAEPLLVVGYEGMKQRETSMPPQAMVRLPEALDRLIEFYTILNKLDELKKYNDLRDAYPKVDETTK